MVPTGPRESSPRPGHCSGSDPTPEWRAGRWGGPSWPRGSALEGVCASSKAASMAGRKPKPRGRRSLPFGFIHSVLRRAAQGPPRPSAVLDQEPHPGLQSPSGGQGVLPCSFRSSRPHQSPLMPEVWPPHPQSISPLGENVSRALP